MAGYFGGFCGKLLGSACLNYHPDGGELGAWWLGWPVIGAWHSALAVAFLLLPYQIISEEEVAKENVMKELTQVKHEIKPSQVKSYGSELASDLKRLATNKILIFDSLAMSFFLFAGSTRSYTAKYVEVQFLTSPAAASLFSGSSSLIGMVTALAISIIIITWFKPPAKLLAGAN